MPGKNRCSYDNAAWRKTVVRRAKRMRTHIRRIMKDKLRREQEPLMMRTFFSLKQ